MASFILPAIRDARDARMKVLMSIVNARNSNVSWDTAPEVLTVKGAAALLRVSRAAIYAAIRLGLLTATNFGKRQTRIAKQVLQEEFRKRGEVFGLTAAFGRIPEA